MSDDEEIIYKGKSVGLYSYLSDLGYVDFETFEPEITKQEHLNPPKDYPIDRFKEDVNNALSKPSSLKVTEHDYRKLVTIFSSQLLFKEDAHLVETLLRNIQVCSKSLNYIVTSSVVLTGVMSSVVMLKNNLNFGLVPAGFTVLFSCYSAWQFYKEFDENRKDQMLTIHINGLKKLSSIVLKLARFIKETEILSNGQVPINDTGSVLYVPLSKHKLADVDGTKPRWRTVPHLKKCLSDTVEEVLHMLKTTVNSLRQDIFCREQDKNHFRFVDGDDMLPCQPYEKECLPVTLLDLKELISNYLCVQSEYLKELALIFSSLFLQTSVSDRHSQIYVRAKVFEIFSNLHKNLTEISFKLMMQYKIHNIESTSKKVSVKSSSRSHVKELSELQNGVHNVFLLLYSALLRVRNVEETLENLPEIGESLKKNDKLGLPVSLDVTEQFTVLKNDLRSTMRYYDLLCQQVTGISQKNTEVETTKQDSESESNVTEVYIKETGIAVGASDFAVNSPDEVFLSLSGIINNEKVSTNELVDDWCVEKKPQIPKSLLTELSQTLKSRKINFIERERDALKRKGLQDTDNPSSSDENNDDSENSYSRKQDKISIKYKRHIVQQDFSHSSDSDDEMDPFEEGAFLTKLKTSKKYQSDPYSDTDSSVSDELSNNPGFDVPCKPSSSAHSLANLAASKSQMWGTNREDYYSDGSES